MVHRLVAVEIGTFISDAHVLETLGETLGLVLVLRVETVLAVHFHLSGRQLLCLFNLVLTQLN